MLRVTFQDQESRDQFASRFNLTTKVDTDKLDITWNLLQFAKIDNAALDYDEIAVLTSGAGASANMEFVVKGIPDVFGPYATVLQDLGNGFYLVQSNDGTTLGDHVESIEANHHGMTLLENVSDLTQVSGTDSTLDPTSAEAQWHRIRCVSRYRPLATSFSTHDLVYVNKPEVYIVDSGINYLHPEFDYPEFEYENVYTCYGTDFGDEKGHGTAVTSMVAGKNLGISSHVKICNVKIADGSSTASLLQVGQALDAILARAAANPTLTRIVNMSWGVARSSWLDNKIEALMNAGVTVICAAGNNGVDVNNISPAGIADVITVASSDKYDIPSGFNDIAPSDAGLTTGNGLLLDVFAPGENIMVAHHSGGYKISSGTSFSAPLVAGVAAVIASLRNGITLYDVLKDFVLSTSTRDALLFTDDRFYEQQNRLLYLFTSDTNEMYKTKDLSMYLGVHDEAGNPIIASTKSAIDTNDWLTVFPDDPIVWSVKFLNDDIKNTYEQYLSINSVTGVLTISKPNTTLPSTDKLKLVDFLLCATNGKISAESATCFFFDTNPLYKETQEGDITLALTETNSISFFQGWGAFIK